MIMYPVTVCLKKGLIEMFAYLQYWLFIYFHLLSIFSDCPKIYLKRCHLQLTVQWLAEKAYRRYQSRVSLPTLLTVMFLGPIQKITSALDKLRTYE